MEHVSGDSKQRIIYNLSVRDSHRSKLELFFMFQNFQFTTKVSYLQLYYTAVNKVVFS